MLKENAVFGVIWNIEDCKKTTSQFSANGGRLVLHPDTNTLIDNKPRSWKATTVWEKKLNDWIWSLGYDGHPRFRDERWQDVFQQQLRSNPVQVLRDSLTGNLPKFSLPLGEETIKWTVWLSEDALWSRLTTLSHVAILKGAQKEAAFRTVKETLQLGDVERNDKGEIAVHGHTYLAWTDRI